MNYFEELQMFLNQSKTKDLKYKHFKKEYNDLNVSVSFGQGNTAEIPWIAFLKQPDTVQQGIYPVYLYYKKENLLFLAYGVSETSKPSRNWNLSSGKTIEKYFQENKLGKPKRYGTSYVCNVYNLNEPLIEDKINNDLDNIINIYKQTFKTANKITTINFESKIFNKKIKEASLQIDNNICLRFISSLLTKPFVILTGLSGSGKTKLAQAFAMWICESKEQYKIVAVGADWTNREPLLGYPNGLEKDSYVKPDSGVLDLILAAKSNTDKPYFLILDEMNLSHVERYFADFLSCMESGEEILLHSGDEEWNGVPAKISLPSNLFIIGTVNIDETTYMFSPKVLDRANVIEFRVTANEMDEYLKNSKPLNLEELTGQGSNMADSFLDIAGNKELVSDKTEEMAGVLINFFTELKKAGAEFGYRTASEIKRFAAVVKEIEPEWKVEEIIDAAIMQKLLPKLHGSRNKLTKVIPILGGLCLNNPDDIKEVYLDKFVKNNITAEQLTADSNIKYHISFEKICRIYKNAVENGFASYAEA